MEKWKPIPGYEGFYEVSDSGRVKSLRRFVKSNRGGTRTCIERILKLGLDTNGYLRVNLSVNASRKIHLVHRLVANAFIGPRPKNYVCCHGDGEKTNNAATNLRYDTYSGNELDKLKHDTHNRGERHPMSKLSVDDVLAIRGDYRPHKTIAIQYGISHHSVGRIKNLRSWRWL